MTICREPVPSIRLALAVLALLALLGAASIAIDNPGQPNAAVSPSDALAGRLSAARLDYKQAQIRLAEARGQATAARRVWERFLGEHFLVHQYAGRNLRARIAAAAAPPAADPNLIAPQPTQTPNPQREELCQQWEELRRQRLRLLDILTAAHPQVGELEQRMMLLKQQADNLPEFIVATEEELPVAQAADKGAELPNQAFAEAAHEEAEASTYNELRASLDAAEKQLQACLVAERRAFEKVAELQAAAATAAPLIPQVASTTPDYATLWMQIAVGVVVSVIGGALWCLYQSAKSGTFASVDEIEESLNLPVIAVLPRRVARVSA